MTWPIIQTGRPYIGNGARLETPIDPATFQGPVPAHLAVRFEEDWFPPPATHRHSRKRTPKALPADRPPCPECGAIPWGRGVRWFCPRCEKSYPAVPIGQGRKMHETVRTALGEMAELVSGGMSRKRAAHELQAKHGTDPTNLLRHFRRIHGPSDFHRKRH